MRYLIFANLFLLLGLGLGFIIYIPGPFWNPKIIVIAGQIASGIGVLALLGLYFGLSYLWKRQEVKKLG